MPLPITMRGSLTVGILVLFGMRRGAPGRAALGRGAAADRGAIAVDGAVALVYFKERATWAL